MTPDHTFICLQTHPNVIIHWSKQKVSVGSSFQVCFLAIKIMRTIDLSDRIPGLVLVEEAVTVSEEASLIESVNKETWSGLGVG